MSKHLPLLLCGLLAGEFCTAAPPASGARDELTPPVSRHRATCPPPGAAPCAMRKPVSAPYRVLTPGIEVDDIGDQWLVNFGKTPARSSPTTLRVLGGNGELHEVTIRFSPR